MPRRGSTAKSFLNAVKEKNTALILEFAADHKSKSPFTFEETIRLLSEDDVSVMWTSIFDMVQKAVPAALEVTDSEALNESMPLRAAGDMIQVTIVLANITLDIVKVIPLGLIQTMILLHGIFDGFSDSKDYLKNSISQLCEKFYINKLDGREELILNSCLYILKRSLRDKAKKKDVKRVWLMSSAIETLVKDKDHKAEFMDILLKCVGSTLYLTCNEGMKFIEFLFGLDVSTIESFHEAVKPYMPLFSLKQSENLGIIYYNTWKTFEKNELVEMKEKLELSCIQDFMYYAIHVERNRPRSLVPILRKFLAVFHKNKKDVKVLRMLRDLYEPILWRALKSPNGNVRSNASQLFFDVFPLEDPDFNIAETEIELQRQLILIQDLLLDECIIVRCISAIGVCLVMGCHWELIPPEMITNYFSILVEKLACDSSSSEVRCSVIKGIRALIMENQMAVPILKVYLTKLQDLFHDISEKVRITFCHLLLAVKKIRFIKYWEIVPIDHLLARLDEDKSSVSKLIVQLLCNSYFPDSKSEEFCFGRSIELIKTDRSASKVFFMHAPEYVSVEKLVKFMVLACRMLNIYVHSKDKKKRKSKESIAPVEDKENQSVSSPLSNSFKSDGPLAFDNLDVVGGLLDCLSVLWIGIQSQLQKPENKNLYKELIARFGKHMPPLLKHFKDTEVWTNVLMLCGLIPPSFIPVLPEICFTQLQNMSPHAKWINYAVLLMCICNQQKNEELLELIQKWIKSGFNKEEPPPKKPKRGKKRQKPGTCEVEPKPLLGVKYLEAVLDQPMCRAQILKLSIPKLKEIVEYIAEVQEIISSSRTTLDNADKKEFLFKCFSSISKLSVLLHGENVMDSDVFMQELLSWCKDVFLKQKGNSSLSRRSRKSSILEPASEMWKVLGLQITEDLLKISSDMILMGFLKNSIKEYVAFCKVALKSEYGPKLLKTIVHFIHQLCDSVKFLIEDVPLQTSSLQVVQETLLFVLKLIEDEQFFTSVSESDLNETKLALRDVLLMLLKIDGVPKEYITTLIKKIVDMLNPVTEVIPSDDEATTKLSHLRASLLFVLTSHNRLAKTSITVTTQLMKDNFSYSNVGFIIASRMIQDCKSLHRTTSAELKKFIEVFEEKLEAQQLAELSDNDRCKLKVAEKQLEALKEYKCS